MELSSDNLFAFVLKKFKQKENKNKQDNTPIFKISRKKISPKKELKLNKSDLINYFHAIIINYSNISNILYNSIDPFINECFNNLEFLSITNNYIRSLDFILNLPNLFFFDVFGNPLEDLSALNKKNIFGYLRLSIEAFNEKKILNIFDLQCGILDIELKDKNNMKTFFTNNHLICMINNEINYIIDKINNEEFKVKSMNKKRLKKEQKQDETNIPNSKKNNNSNLKSDINLNNNNIEVNKDNNKFEKTIEKIIPKNPFLIKIKNFFDEYQNVIDNTLLKEYNKYYFENKNRTKVNNTNNNEFFSIKNFSEDKNYLAHEKDKLLLLFDVYKKISIFNKDKKDNKYFIGNIYTINTNNNIDNLFINEIKDNINNHSQCIRASIIILISVFFYTIGTISGKMMNALISYILTKYYKYDEDKKKPDFANMGNIHYLAFYYSTYDYIYKRMIDNEKHININKYKDILNILKMNKLILKSNFLYQKLQENKSIDNNKEFYQLKKNRINNEIIFIKNLRIMNEFLVLIEFLCDYIIFEKIEELLINNSYPGEYSYIIELKETIEDTEFKVNNQNLLSSLSLSAIKFQKNKKDRIFNKFYFEKNKIKQIKNKNFKNFIINDFNKSKTMNNFNPSLAKSLYFNKSNSNFKNINNYNINNEENEYNKNDDIDVNEFFFIDSNTRNNRLSQKKINNNTSLYNIKDKDNDYNNNSYIEENNISFKLPYLDKNYEKPYDEFEFFKKMIFNPDFLSQHARNVIKFEKMSKKLKRYPNLMNKYNNRISLSHNKLDDIKKIQVDDNGESPCFTNNDNNNSKFNTNYLNKSKINLNIESNSNDNSLVASKGKIFLNSNSYIKNKFKSENNFNTNEKMNFKTINYKDKEDQDKITKEKDNKTIYHFNRKSHCYKHMIQKQFFEVPESFPGITLLKFGLKKKKKLNPKNIKSLSKKSPSTLDIKDNKRRTFQSYKEKVINKIRQTVKDNITRNCMRVVCPFQYIKY